MEEINTSIKGEVANISKDFLEFGVDSFLKDGTLKDLPLIGPLFGLTQIGLNIHDKLFIKKIHHFLFELRDISIDERKKFTEKIETDKSFKTKVNENLLLIIDRFNDYTKAEYIGKLFAATINGNIDYRTFLKLSNIIDKSVCSDLENLTVIHDHGINRLDDYQKDELYILGLLYNEGISGDTFLHDQDDKIPNTKNEYVINKYGKIIIEHIFKATSANRR